MHGYTGTVLRLDLSAHVDNREVVCGRPFPARGRGLQIPSYPRMFRRSQVREG